MNIIKLSILLVFAVLFSSSTLKKEELNYYQEDTQQVKKGKYRFTIEFKESDKNFPEEITIEVDS